MNYDPIKFCVHGRHMKPKAEFRPLPGLKHRREVCASCYETIMAARKKMRGHTMPKVPF